MKGIGPIQVAILCAASAGSLSSCGEKRPNNGEVGALMDTSRAWSASVKSGDVNWIVSFWTDDAIVMMPGEPIRRGKGEIAPFVEQSLKTPGFSISWEPIEGTISKSGDIGYLIERERMTFPDGHGGIIQRIGRGVTVWKKQPDGSWKNAPDVSQAVKESVLRH